MLGLIGKKIGMTRIFVKEGEVVPVTVVELGPCTVVQKKIAEGDGYNALQLGFGRAKPKNVTKACKGHFEKAKLPYFKHLKEFRTEKAGDFNVGDELLVSAFKEGEKVNIIGRTKGKGFQGVIKRHGKHGGPASHGSDFHRRPGSIGMRTWPSRVPKNMGMAGHMGDEQVTIEGLEVVKVRLEDNVLLVKGAVPGATDSILFVTPCGEELAGRPDLLLKGGRPEGRAKEESAEKAEKKEAAHEAEVAVKQEEKAKG
jgi:large subunit ribosomal protein L3